MASDPIITMNFYVYGSLTYVSKLWQNVAALVHSTEYKALITVVFLISVFLSFISNSANSLTQGRSPTSWLTSSIMGILVFYFFFSGNIVGENLGGKIVIKDEVTGGSLEVADLPPGLVLIAGIVNNLQRAIEKLIITNYTNNGGSNPYELVMQTKIARDFHSAAVRSIILSALPAGVQQSIKNYINDVASIEMSAHPDKANELMNTSNDLLSTMGKLANPVLTTVTYLDNNGNVLSTGQVVTGDDAWNRLNQYFTNSTQWNTVIKVICKYYGFDVASASLTDCENMLRGIADDLAGVSMTSTQLMKNLTLKK